jgi:hypothetical protein
VPEGRPPAIQSGPPDQGGGGDGERNRRRRGRDRDRGERRGNTAAAQRSEPQRPAQPAAGAMPPPRPVAPATEPASIPEAPAREYAVNKDIQTDYRPASSKPEPGPVPPTQDPADLERALVESGLEQVRTRSTAITESAPEPEFVPARRDRRSPPPDFAEPLVQVETVHKEDTPN